MTTPRTTDDLTPVGLLAGCGTTVLVTEARHRERAERLAELRARLAAELSLHDFLAHLDIVCLAAAVAAASDGAA